MQEGWRDSPPRLKTPCIHGIHNIYLADSLRWYLFPRCSTLPVILRDTSLHLRLNSIALADCALVLGGAFWITKSSDDELNLQDMVRKRGLEPLSLSALAPKASVFAISPLPH